jgi:hypothetical protein
MFCALSEGATDDGRHLSFELPLGMWITLISGIRKLKIESCLSLILLG